MHEAYKENPSSEPFWRRGSRKSKRARRTHFGDFSASLDEAPDFHDPFSDLNLFLSQKIKEELPKLGITRRWTTKLQEFLLKAIAPEFQEKFPRYRLGVAALKKTFEKIVNFTDQIQNEQEAFTKEGKLNLGFLIRENLKQLDHISPSFQIHPYHIAHRIAMKMSEFVATIDGIRPKIDALATTIWSLQRHLLPSTSTQGQCPYEEYDQIDKLIVKIILETTAKDPFIGQDELEYSVNGAIDSLSTLPNFATYENMHACVSSLLAEKLFATSPFHTKYASPQKQSVLSFIQRHVQSCRASCPSLTLTEVVRRVMALYTLASNLPKDISEENLIKAAHAVYPIAKEKRPLLSQSIYAFICAELVLHTDPKEPLSQKAFTQIVCSLYKEAITLPEIESTDQELLEILTWKKLSEQEAILQKLPYLIGGRIEEEVASLRIDTPSQTFGKLVSDTVTFFQRIRYLSIEDKNAEVSEKIHNWCIQSDMLLRNIRLESASPLIQLIKDHWSQMQADGVSFNPEQLVSQVSQDYLKLYPHMTTHALQLHHRLHTLVKYCWYNAFASKEESSLDRFKKWHQSYLKLQNPTLSQEAQKEQLQSLYKKRLPLIPELFAS